MRLWHYKLIPVLPRQQLLGQRRELSLIAKNIAEKGTPGHILVNPIMDYPLDDFFAYWFAVDYTARSRGYDIDAGLPYRHGLITCHDGQRIADNYCYYDPEHLDIFKGWHTDRYYVQCLYNLQEKYDRGGISEEEWRILHGERRIC